MIRSVPALCCGFLLWAIPAVFAQSYNIATVAGTTRLRQNVAATTVPLRSPWGVAQDAAGNIYFADQFDDRILHVAPDGNLTVLAGTGVAGFSGDNGPAAKAEFDTPRAVRLDGKGALYVGDYNNNRVRKIVLATGIITTAAGNGEFRASGDRGPATQAGLDPDDIAVDGAGNLYIADYLNHRIRKVAATDGTITTIAGNGIEGYTGDTGLASQAVLDGPTGISVNSQGVIYFADSNNDVVRKIDQNGIITTVAGDGFIGLEDNAAATNAPLFFPMGTAVEANGNVLILELNYLQRLTVADGKIHVVAGSDSFGFGGDGGSASGAQYALPIYVAAAANGDILLSDLGNYRVRRIRSTTINTVAGTAINDNIPATSAYLNQAEDAIPDGKGGFYISDTEDHRIRAVSGGTITNLIGSGVPGSKTGQFSRPSGIATDSRGNVYIADWGNDRIVRFVPGGSATVIAGGTGTGFSGDNNGAILAKLNGPTGVAVDAAGNIYIADSGNCRVRMIDANQTITTLAGTGSCVFTGDNGPAAQASVSPVDLALDSAGNLYVADDFNNRIRKINLSTKIITTVAGAGSPGYSGDGGLATTAQLNLPKGVAVDAAGNVYIADWGNSVVRVVRGNTISTIAGTGESIFDSETGPALGVSIDPIGISVDTDGSVYIADNFNDRIRKLTVAVPASLTIVSGDGQSGAPGNKIPLSVKIKDASGTPVAGVTVNFTVASGAATLSVSAAQTDVTGVATVQATLGATAGPVQIKAASAGLSPVTFNLTVVIPVPVNSGPAINSGGVAGAGLSIPAVTTLSAGGIASVFGKGFGGGATFQKVGTADLVNGKVPTSFRGICVDLSGTRAFIFGASDTQVNFQVPALGSATSVALKVIANCGAATEAASAAVNVPIAAATPEFFYFAYNAGGRNPVAATDSVTGAYLGSGAGFVAAQPSEYVTAYATGFGATNPAIAPGDFPGSGLAQAAGSVTVLLNGNPLPAANVLYAGITPGSPGLYQLNLLLPPDTPDGDLSLVIQIGGASSPPGAYLTVKKQ